MECTTIAYNKRHYFPKHVHPDRYTFSLVLKGNAHLISKGKCRNLTSGDLVMIPPNVAHQTLVEHCFIYKLIRVPLPYSFKNRTNDEIRIIPLGKNNQITKAFELWYDAIVTSTDQMSGHQINRVSIPTYFKSFLEFESNYDSDCDMTMKKTIDFFNENLNRPISTEELSDFLCMSQSHFQRVFKNTVGISPKRYLMNLRIETSKELIKEVDNFTDIAYSTGFYDQSHFIRYFKINVGMIPKRYSDFIRNDRIIQF